MKKYIYLFFLLSLCPLLARAADDNPIAKQLFNVTSGDLKLSFMVGTDGRLYQLAFGDEMCIRDRGTTDYKAYDNLDPFTEGLGLSLIHILLSI